MPTLPRTLLFVSAERPERFDKAMASGADVVCIDLEDAVHPDRKDAARNAAMAYLLGRAKGNGGGSRLGLRINTSKTLVGLRDVMAIAEAGVHMDVLLVPKAESSHELEAMHAWLPQAFTELVALVETPLGVERATEIAAAARHAAPRLSALMLGGADLSMELGARFDWDGLLSARGRLVNAARAWGLQAWDVPFIAIADEPGLVQETRRVLDMGFDCKAAIHPNQIAPMHGVFQPSQVEILWAKGVCAAAVGGHGAFLYEGRMVDTPLLRRAERILQRAN
ncbi:HpcH/HpaI aldolase/citrate lyase family protein [Limnohabitans sp.]|jgi:citrate lyase beta subunit|uniref:HpcH/HpaI aldolase/citrate lyase family protein n=1 Tax=Limnohabitans sp. TaxID=1907725 RepID=UPI0037C13D0E